MAKKSDQKAAQKSKDSAIEHALSQIEKQHGKGSIMRLGTSERKLDIRTISTGALSLDAALGVGGLPKGRIIEIYGPEASGKTTLALHAIANAQKAGGIAVLIDAEYAFDPTYAQNLGVDVDNLLVHSPILVSRPLKLPIRLSAAELLILLL